MNIPSPTTSPNSSQQGSVVVIFAISIVMLIALLGSIQIGYTAYQKRELQKTADMVALSAVQNLQTVGCDLENASDIAHENDKTLGTLQSSQMQCGTWNPDDGFLPATENLDAVQISLSKEATSLLPLPGAGSQINVSATAAHTEPLAAFSLGSRLLSLDPDGLVGSVLDRLGLDPELLTVLDHDGLVNARLTPSGLLAALQVIDSDIDIGAGTPTELLDLAPIKVGNLLLASTKALGSQLLNAQLTALETVAANLNASDLTVKLFGDGDDNPGILVIDTTNPQAALHTAIGVQDLIASSILIANEGHAINIPFTGLNLGLLSVETSEAYIVAPPTITIGGKGTKAENAQVRVNVHVTDTTPLSGLNLNLQLKLATAEAEVSELTCKAKPEANEATFITGTKLAELCIIPRDAPPGYLCSDNAARSSKIEILDVLGAIPVSVTPKTNLLPFTEPNETSITLNEPPAEPAVATLKAQASLSNLSSALINTVLGDIVGSILSNTGRIPSRAQKDATTKLMLNNDNDVEQVQQVLKQSEEHLTALKNDDSGFVSPLLIGVVDGLLDVVVPLVSGLTGAVDKLLEGLLCWLIDCTNIKVNGVQQELFGGNNAVKNQNGLAVLAVSLLSPLLTPLDDVLNHLLDTLGLNVAEADLKLLSVQCGLPQLVE